MSVWGQLATIFAKYLSQPMTEYFKNVTRIKIAENPDKIEGTRKFFRTIGNGSINLQQRLERLYYKDDSYKNKYDEVKDEILLTERGINKFFDYSFYCFLFGLGYFLLHQQSSYGTKHAVHMEAEVERIYEKLAKYNEKLDILQEIYNRGLPDTSVKIDKLEEFYELMHPQMILAETYSARIAEETQKHKVDMKKIEAKIELLEKRKKEKGGF